MGRCAAQARPAHVPYALTRRPRRAIQTVTMLGHDPPSLSLAVVAQAILSRRTRQQLATVQPEMADELATTLASLCAIAARPASSERPGGRADAAADEEASTTTIATAHVRDSTTQSLSVGSQA